MIGDGQKIVHDHLPRHSPVPPLDLLHRRQPLLLIVAVLRDARPHHDRVGGAGRDLHGVQQKMWDALKPKGEANKLNEDSGLSTALLLSLATGL